MFKNLSLNTQGDYNMVKAYQIKAKADLVQLEEMIESFRAPNC